MILQGRTAHFGVNQDGSPNTHGPLRFGNFAFNNIRLSNDKSSGLSDEIMAAEFKATALGDYALFSNQIIHFDEPVELSCDLHVSLFNCWITAPEGYVPFDIEAAKTGGPLRFGLPREQVAEAT